MTKPNLSIIIPAYNCSDQISTIVNSIIKQDFKDWELIIVDDKSTDQTPKVLADIAKTDSRIKVYHQSKNGGASVARNAGIKHASGKYLMFFDADDNIKPKTLSRFINNIDKSADLVVSGFTLQIIKSGKITKTAMVCKEEPPKQDSSESFRLYILRLLGYDGRLYQVWNKLYRTDIIKRHRLTFQPGINFGEDLVFNFDYFSHMTNKITFIDWAGYVYKQDMDGGTFSKSSLIYENRLANFRELESFLANEPDSPIKNDLLNWINYSWLYSHLSAIANSKLPYSEKIKRLKATSRLFSYPPIGDKKIIGGKRRKVEFALRILIKHPRFCCRLMRLNDHVKNSALFGKIWQLVRKRLSV